MTVTRSLMMRLPVVMVMMMIIIRMISLTMMIMMQAWRREMTLASSPQCPVLGRRIATWQSPPTITWTLSGPRGTASIPRPRPPLTWTLTRSQRSLICACAGTGAEEEGAAPAPPCPAPLKGIQVQVLFRDQGVLWVQGGLNIVKWTPGITGTLT